MLTEQMRETLESMPITEIVEGQRFRKNMGDIDALASSIRDIGLLQPIGVDDEHRLVFGGRRLAAFRLLDRAMYGELSMQRRVSRGSGMPQVDESGEGGR